MNVIKLYLLFIFVSPFYVWSQTHKAQTAIEDFAKHPNLQSASISFMAVAAKDNRTIAAYDANRVLVPASTMKLWSTAAGFELLGKDYKAKTEVYYTGEITQDSILRGSVIIKGFGDVTLGSSYFKDRANMRDFFKDWVEHFQAQGIKVIEGDIFADASSFGYFGVPEGWTWSDMGNYYGAFPSGLTLFDNLLELYFNTSKTKLGETWIVETNPTIPNFVIQNHVRSDAINSDNAYVFAAPYSHSAFVTGTLPMNKTKFKVKAAIQNPEALFAREFYSALQKAGIQILGKASSNKEIIDSENVKFLESIQNKTLLFTHYGNSFSEVAHFINHKSVNLFAEHVIHWLALQKEGAPLAYHSAGMEILIDFWKNKFDIKSARIVDGSGLSRSNLISAQQFVNLLHYMKDNAYFEQSLPTAGQSGTLKSLCAGQPCSGKIRAKSGTINRVKAYAGYAYNIKGEKVIFAFLVNNYTGTNSELNTLMQNVLNAVVS